MRKITTAMREAVFLELKRQKVTQRQLAEKLGVSPQYVGQILNGQRSQVSDAWEDILEALGLKVEVTKE